MGKGVFVDEKCLEERVDYLFKSKKSLEVGLLIGLKSMASKDFLVALLPSPAKEDEKGSMPAVTSSTGKNSSSSGLGNTKAAKSSFLLLDEEWISEHGRQVSRMLLGGLQVLGIYVFATDDQYKNSISDLWQVSKSVAELSSKSGLKNSVNSQHVLLHICSIAKRYTFRSSLLNGSFVPSSIQPCEHKFGKLLGSFHVFSCTYNVDLRLVVDAKTSKPPISLKRFIDKAFEIEEKRLKTSEAIVDNNLVSIDKSIQSSGFESTNHSVQILVPPTWQLHTQAESEDVDGLLLISGSIHGQSYAHCRETFGKAIDDLKDDLIFSLKTRLELLVDEAEQQYEDSLKTDNVNVANDSTQKPNIAAISAHPLLAQRGENVQDWLSTFNNYVMPRRVVIPWENGFDVCDHIMPRESLVGVEERCTAMFSMHKVEVENINQPEILSTNSVREFIWNFSSPPLFGKAYASKTNLVSAHVGKTILSDVRVLKCLDGRWMITLALVALVLAFIFGQKFL